MGVSISWIGIRGVPREVSLGKAGLALTADTGDFLPPGPAPSYTGQMGRAGWHVIVGRGCDDRLISDDTARRLSEDAESVTCSVEEHVMYIKTEFWRNSARLWSVRHRGDVTLSHVDKSGSVPDRVESSIDEALTGLSDDDDPPYDHVFEAIARAAKNIAGFRYDEEMDDYEVESFHTLKVLDGSPLAGKKAAEGRKW